MARDEGAKTFERGTRPIMPQTPRKEESKWLEKVEIEKALEAVRKQRASIQEQGQQAVQAVQQANGLILELNGREAALLELLKEKKEEPSDEGKTPKP